MKNNMYILIVMLFTICCSNNRDKGKYSINIHYQYIVFKEKKLNNYGVYVENFLNIKNNTSDTLIIPQKQIENNLKMISKNGSSISLNFISDSNIRIAPLDSIDLNCAVNLNINVKNIPVKVNKEDYRIYDNLTKKYLLNSDDYEIIRTTKFGIFKDEYFN